jgi:hypothetical protein
MMPVNRTLREGAGVKPGDIVALVMERDDQVGTVAAPVGLKKALAKHKAAQGNWEKLAFTHQKEMIEGAKQEETRVRRLANVMQVLETGTKWTG